MKKGKTCANCQSERFQIKARGLCKRCYPLVLKKEKALKWNCNKPLTLKNCPFPYTGFFKSRFSKFKKSYISIIEERLRVLAINEQILLNKSANPMQLELQLNRIFGRTEIKNSKSITHGWAAIFDQNFDQKQRHLLYAMFNKIEEGFFWPGLSLRMIIQHSKKKK